MNESNHAPNRTNRGRKFLPDILQDGEIQAMLRLCNPRYPTGLRNRALLALLYRSGVRISEALGLEPKDVSPSRGELRVHWAKGGRSRVCGMDVAAFELVGSWLVRRADWGISRTAPVFCTLRGKRISTAYVRALLRRLGRKAGIEKRVHAHAFRHTFASQALAEGASVGVISKQLGHRSIATTVRYLEHIAPQDVVDWVRGREWGGVGRAKTVERSEADARAVAGGD